RPPVLFRQRRSQEEDEERSQAVVREPLPHFREEQRRQARRVAEKPPVVLGGLQTGGRLVMCDRAGRRLLEYGIVVCHEIDPGGREAAASAGSGTAIIDQGAGRPNLLHRVEIPPL